MDKPPKIKKTKSSTPIAAPEDIVARLRITPEVTIPGSKPFIPAAHAIRQMMIDRIQAADEIERLRLLILELQAALMDARKDSILFAEGDRLKNDVAGG